QISSCPVVLLRQRMSLIPSPLKSRCPTIAQGFAAEPGEPPPTTLVPFTNQVTTCPLAVLYQTMSLWQSPLKSWGVGATNTHVAPTPLLSLNPPTTAVLQDSATEPPGGAPVPPAPVPTSLFPCWVHAPPLRVNTHAAPIALLSLGPATMAVLPLPDSATRNPGRRPQPRRCRPACFPAGSTPC